MTYWLSKPIEGLHGSDIQNVDVVIVGSGYGAAFAALAIAKEHNYDGKKKRIWVLERGNEYVPGDFPKTIGDLPGYVGFVNDGKHWGRRDALWDIRIGEGVSVISGSGLGGTSLVNANVAMRPRREAFRGWPEPSGGEDQWEAALKPSFEYVEDVLGVTKHPNAESLNKYKSLETLARSVDAKVQPAPIAVSFKNGKNCAGVEQSACIDCGNCVTGCNIGAKNTLNMNAWPLAYELGVELFTGATVQRLARNSIKSGYPWSVKIAATRDPSIEIPINANTVILSAGAIGSTEILKSSAQTSSRLKFSNQLGKKFSTNGDSFAIGFGQKNKVYSRATRPSVKNDFKSCDVGPTIVGYAEASLPHSETLTSSTITLEDGSVPYSLSALWQEMAVTQSFFRRYVRGRQTAWYRQNSDHDFLARSSSLADHSQTLLTMGMDQCHGELKSTKGSEYLIPCWKSGIAEKNIYVSLHECLRTAEDRNGFDGGQYLPNPLWKLFPDGFEGVVGGADAMGSRLVTVHPLGGCSMGSTADTGVVNASGQVFDPTRTDDTGTYTGLYVLDGSIIPGPIGTNPFLTIAAVSHHLAKGIAKELNRADKQSGSSPVLEEIPEGSGYTVHNPTDTTVSGTFRERLFYRIGSGAKPGRKAEATLAGLSRAFGKDEDYLEGAKGLAVDIEIELEDLNRWLETTNESLNTKASVYKITRDLVDTVPDSYLSESTRICELTGEVRLEIDRPGGLARCWRILLAWIRFIHYRRDELWESVEDHIRGWFKKREKGAPEKGSALKGYVRVGGLHAIWRRIVYDLSGEVKDGIHSGSVRLSGRKLLAFAAGKPDIWTALLNLPAKITFEGAKYNSSFNCDFEVDLIRIADGPSPIQIAKSPDTVNTVLAIIGISAYFLRIFLQTHFWSFGAASYSKYKEKKELAKERLEEPADPFRYQRDGRTYEASRSPPWFSEDGWARLMRFQPDEKDRNAASPRESVLLIHGLAHSSRVFWTNSIQTNFLQHLLGQGYDVWIIDHRTSANTVQEVNPEHTWDHIARKDIRSAVDHIFDTINEGKDGDRKGIHVFAHCIGSGAFAMAVLEGAFCYEVKGESEPRSKIVSCALHAVPPWLYASRHNRARANFYGAFKDYDLFERLDPIPHKHCSFLEILYDRIASSLPHDPKNWSGFRRDRRGQGFPRVTYSRYTLFWGRQWNQENINRKIQENFPGMIGPVPVEVIRQVYFSIIRGRLTDRDGSNTYVSDSNFRRHWTFPTLFLHGTKNEVFDIEGSKLSAHLLTRIRAEKEIEDLKPCWFDEWKRKWEKKYNRQWDDAYEHTWLEEIQEYLKSRVDSLVFSKYSEKGVWIEILENYGHMDVIFGVNAHKDVHGKVSRFFDRSSDANTRLEPTSIEKSARPLSYTWPDNQPNTGPIISRPYQKDKPKALRVWAESTDFSTSYPTRLEVKSISSPPLANTISVPHEPLRWRSQFWVGDLERMDGLNGPVSLSVRYDVKAPAAVPPRYSVMSGTFPQPPAGESKRTMNWPRLPWFQRAFKGKEQASKSASFLIGSCLYPGTSFERLQSDQIFTGMLPHIEGTEKLPGVDHLLLVGDQIYADATADLFDPTSLYERYRDRYRRAFTGEFSEKVMSHLPTYFAIDDHEIVDNWQGPAKSTKLENQYKIGREEARCFQIHENISLDGPLYYTFDSRGFSFFVFDTRSERTLKKRSEPEALMKKKQLDEFKKWTLENYSDVMFIVTGSPISLISKAGEKYARLYEHHDTLLGYPGFLAEITEILSKHNQKEIIWLSGDIHFSGVSKMRMQCREHYVDLTHICASGLFTPLPFINNNSEWYAWGRPVNITLNEPPVYIEAEQYFLSDAPQHFVRFDLHDTDFKVQAFDVTGKVTGHYYSYAG